MPAARWPKACPGYDSHAEHEHHSPTNRAGISGCSPGELEVPVQEVLLRMVMPEVEAGVLTQQLQHVLGSAPAGPEAEHACLQLAHAAVPAQSGDVAPVLNSETGLKIPPWGQPPGALVGEGCLIMAALGLHGWEAGLCKALRPLR